MYAWVFRLRGFFSLAQRMVRDAAAVFVRHIMRGSITKMDFEHSSKINYGKTTLNPWHDI